ncbi:hypothetical protein BDV96DRAFT_644830 [Lophiotrema nucula]|uniref:Uncharacterized protein n=1 Tax=Lophiotrema nucula TaxID=690887 RepID=A0A6A5ZFA1_9PLEO|nr:hypothetical protein BDV96DRAFT_644830 [Lophiotrema nucula]
MSLPPPPAEQPTLAVSTSIAHFTGPNPSELHELVAIPQSSTVPSSLIPPLAQTQTEQHSLSSGKPYLRWRWLSIVTVVVCILAIFGIPAIFYAESFRRAFVEANVIARQNTELTNISLAFTEWNVCVKKQVETLPRCREADRRILDILNPAPALAKRSSPRKLESSSIYSHYRSYSSGTIDVAWVASRLLDVLAIVSTGRTWSTLTAESSTRDMDTVPIKFAETQTENSTSLHITKATSLLCALFIDRSPAASIPYRRLVALLATIVNGRRSQHNHAFAYTRPLTNTLVMALPSYTINAVYFEGHERTTMMFYSALFYNPVWFRYFTSVFNSEAKDMPTGFRARTSWAILEGVPLLPVSFFLMFEFLPLLEYLHRKSLKPHHQPLIRRPLLSALRFKFQVQRSGLDKVFFCGNVALGVWILYNAWSTWLMMGAFFYFVFWDPKILRRDGNGLLVQVLSLVSILTAFLNQVFSE